MMRNHPALADALETERSASQNAIRSRFGTTYGSVFQLRVSHSVNPCILVSLYPSIEFYDFDILDEVEFCNKTQRLLYIRFSSFDYFFFPNMNFLIFMSFISLPKF
jgi:hypothetical protein